MASDQNNAKAAREAAAQARRAAEADLRSRDRKIRIIGGAVVALIMAGLLAIPLLQGKAKGPETDTSAVLPAGVSSETYGVQYGPAWSAADADSIPLVQIWEDFQCPACASFEAVTGQTITELADAGKIRLEFRPTIFLDQNLKALNTAAGNPNSSAYATMAFGCAADAGKAAEFHSLVFQSQPGNEGTGFSISDLTNIAMVAGVSDIDTFTECVSSKKYEGWVNNSYDAFSKEGVSATPTVFLNGKELSGDVIRNVAALTAAIEEAGATK
jgi:protein-disulfide isomerase